MRDFRARFDLHSGPGMYSNRITSDLKGKNKMVELDDSKWEEQFRQFEDNMKDDQANKAIDEELDAHESEQFFGDFESIWNGIRAEDAERIHGSDPEFIDRFNEDGYDSSDVFDGKPDLGDYLFEPSNPYMTHPDPFTEGVRLTETGGSLTEAALCFEAVCQRDSGRVEGWTWLGSVQAQNEKELAAIRALEQSIRLNESNLPALMVFQTTALLILESGSFLYERRIRYCCLSYSGTVVEYEISVFGLCPAISQAFKPLKIRNSSSGNRSLYSGGPVVTRSCPNGPGRTSRSGRIILRRRGI